MIDLILKILKKRMINKECNRLRENYPSLKIYIENVRRQHLEEIKC